MPRHLLNKLSKSRVKEDRVLHDHVPLEELYERCITTLLSFALRRRNIIMWLLRESSFGGNPVRVWNYILKLKYRTRGSLETSFCVSLIMFSCEIRSRLECQDERADSSRNLVTSWPRKLHEDDFAKPASLPNWLQEYRQQRCSNKNTQWNGARIQDKCTQGNGINRFDVTSKGILSWSATDCESWFFIITWLSQSWRQKTLLRN